jgi:hypothetical protein
MRLMFDFSTENECYLFQNVLIIPGSETIPILVTMFSERENYLFLEEFYGATSAFLHLLDRKLMQRSVNRS